MPLPGEARVDPASGGFLAAGVAPTGAASYSHPPVHDDDYKEEDDLQGLRLDKITRVTLRYDRKGNPVADLE